MQLVLWCEGWTGGGWLRGPLGSAEAQPGRGAAGMWDSLLPGLPAAPGGQDFSSQFCPHSHCPEQAPRPVCGAHVLHSHPFSCPCARGFTHGCKGHPRAHGDITLSQWISVEWATHWPTWTHAHTRAHTFPHGAPCPSEAPPLARWDLPPSGPFSCLASAVIMLLPKGTRARHLRQTAPQPPPPRSESTMSRGHPARPQLGPPSPSPLLR